MGLFILQETPVGYALLKAKSSKILKHETLSGEDETVERVCSLLKLRNFHKFDSAATALEQSAALIEGKVTPRLAGLLDSIKDERKASLAVADPKLANAINKLPQLSLNLISDSTTTDLYRSIRNHLSSLIPGLLPEDISTMSLGLSHSLSRHKLKFSPDKVDTMIVQAIALLDDLDKELNTYSMRVREWYGWHFPEMARIINDNLAYSRVILQMGMRNNAANADLAEILPEEIEIAVKSASEISMGTEITQEDLENIQALAEQVVSFTEYRAQLSGYLSARMMAIAPNLTTLVGELVGARLIAHAGSLMNLAKSPASTIQVLGAEKALFRALKTKHDTPKYGLIYHASLVGQATGKNKGKIARMLATKAALGLRVDALADWNGEIEGKGDSITEEEKSALGVAGRVKIERRLANLEGKPIRLKGVSIAPSGNLVTSGKWEIKEARKYNPDADGLAGDEPAAVTVAKKSQKSSLNGREPGSKLIEEIEEPDLNAQPRNQLVSDNDNLNSTRKSKHKRVSSSTKSLTERAPLTNATQINGSAIINGNIDHNQNHEDASETISADSAEPSDPPNLLSQLKTDRPSSTAENPMSAKKARKKERHEQKLAESEERSKRRALLKAKLERKISREERRQQRIEQIESPEESDDAKLTRLAAQAGISIARYRKKLARGEIRFNPDGKPEVIHKKDAKKAKLAEEKANSKVHEASSSKKKRKREEAAEDVGKLKKSKKTKARENIP